MVEAFTGEPVGEDSHTAEAALDAGLVDEVVDAGDADARLAAWVGLLHPGARDGALPAAEHVDEPVVEIDARDAVRRSRRTDRAGLANAIAETFVAFLSVSAPHRGGRDR